jgi:hypothetical protein
MSPMASDDGADDTVDELLRAAARAPDVPLPRERYDRPTFPDAQEKPPPATLGTVERESYRIAGEHARGGMGRILIAHQARLGRVVAVKELIARDPAAEVRFMREALLTARLEHPSIIPVHDAGHWPSGEPFYVMKLVSGRPLSMLIAERRTLRERLALLPTVIAASEAIAYAHSRRIIHRDLKPSNILQGDFGETVVIDWGLGKSLETDPSLPAFIEGESDRVATQAGEIVGTPDFMSPEQAEGRTLDERADVYALGAILYVLLAGRPPYEGASPPEIIRSVRTGSPPALSSRVRGVPLDLLAIVDKAMARDLSLRYPTAGELAADLRRFQAGQLVAAYRYPRHTRVRRWAARHPALTAALLVSALIGAVSFTRIVAERDRAERERAVAEAARVREAQATDRAALVQARQLLDHDPTASLIWLKRLRPSFPDWSAAQEVAQEAIERGVAERIFDVGSPVVTFEVGRDEKSLITAGEDGRLRVWQLGDGRARDLGTVPAPRQLALSPDGKWLAVAGQRVALLPIAGGRELPLPTHQALALAFSPDGTRLALAAPDGKLHLVPLDGSAAISLTLSAPAVQLAWSHEGKWLALRARDRVQLVDADGAPHALGDGAVPGSGNLRFSEDGKWLAAAGRGLVRLWEWPLGRAHDLTAEGEVADVAFSPTAPRLGAASADGAVRIWELPALSSTQLAHSGAAAHELVFASDGKSLIVTRGNLVRIYSLPSGHVRKLRGHTAEVSTVRFLANGQALSGSLDGTVRQWSLSSLGPPADPARLSGWLDWVALPVTDEHPPR